jgi:serine/threonine-protein kinase
MYTSNESGTLEVYVRSFPDKGDKWQVSSGGGTYPAWSSDRRTIFFRTLDNQIMTASYTIKGDVFSAEKPRLWSEQHLAEVGNALNYSLDPDGKRVVAVMAAGSSAGTKEPTHVTIMFNFLDELRRRAPAGK